MGQNKGNYGGAGFKPAPNAFFTTFSLRLLDNPWVASKIAVGIRT